MWLALVLPLVFLASREPALAFVQTGQVGSIAYRVMAPDWICRGEVVSLLIVVSVDAVGGAAEHSLVATLEPPGGGFEAAPDTTVERRVQLAPGQVERFSFSGWKARVDADLGRFTFGLRLESPLEKEKVTLAVPVDTIRGAAVPRGKWSILVPVAISLLALPLFAFRIRRTARPRAWRRAEDLDIPPAEDAWWTSER